MVGIRALDGELVGALVLGPEHPLIDVAWVVLPVLVGAVQPLGEALLLLVLRDVQHDLHDARAAVGDATLERGDVVVALLDLVGGGELAHPPDEHVLVVRAVEDADLADGGQLLLDPPQEVVAELLLGGALEGRELHALRVDGADDVAHDAALARRVHGLDDEQYAARLAGGACRVQPFLQGAQLVDTIGERPFTVSLVAVEAGGGARVDVVQSYVGGCPQQLVHDPRLPGSAVSAWVSRSTWPRSESAR